jgi:hypothetical protein
MSQQMNFEKGVDYKATKNAATCGEAEKGEAKRPVQQFPCDVPPPKGRTPRPGPQMNFPN